MSLFETRKKNNDKSSKKNILFIIVITIICLIIQGVIIFFIPYLSYTTAKVEVNNDISKYNDYIGPVAKKEYKNKWDMDESIFPTKITNNMNVIDYKMVYYNPWDAQYLSYLVIEYNKEDYQEEVKRLSEYKSTNYLGYYNVTGFTKYNLLAMYADSYNGFVYAITNNDNQIIYVELIFCNYFYDLDYKQYINNDYLPDNFDATIDNSYGKRELSKKN